MNGDSSASSPPARPGAERSDDGEGGRRESGLIARLRAMIGISAPRGEDAAAEAGETGADPEPAVSQARRDMIARVAAFDEKRVLDVMAPRADIRAVDIDTPLPELLAAFTEAGHSRMPIYRGELDDPVGMVHIKDVVALIAAGENGSENAGESPCGSAPVEEPVLKFIRRDILYAPPSMRVTDLLLRMQASRIHMALVIDEYGGTDGLVTIENLVEEIVGEINDEHDEDDAAAVSILAGGGWEVDARVELDAFAAETGFRLETDEEDEIDTVGGYVATLAGRVPQRGEVLAGAHGFDIEVTEADARKVRKLRIRPAASGRSEAAE